MNELELWKRRAEALWDLLDDIDTADDAAKSNDKLYRILVRRFHDQRWRYASSDGYKLYWKDLP